MNVEQWPIDRIIPYARNPRKITQRTIDKVASSIKEFGFRQPLVLTEEGVIIAGHARYYAAQKLQLETVPVEVPLDLSDIKAKAYRLTDNRTAMEAGFDEELLALEIEELKEFDFDLSLTGFDEDELDKLLNDSFPDEDDFEVKDEKKFLLMIEFPNEQELERYYNEFSQKNYECKIIE